MRLLTTIFLILALAALCGCGGRAEQQMVGPVASAPNTTATDSVAAQGGGGDVAMKTVSLERTEDTQQAAQQQPQQPGSPAPVERKIIRNATITLEVEQPSKAMQRIASIAESRGGFVVTSDSRQQTTSKGAQPYEVITVELRVPATQFDAALADIRAAGGNVTAQKITGKDVTEEYIDLEARLRTQRALEAQLLEIMKGAHEVADAVSVQRELTNVRTEIERVEGRRRFLENQSSLSTINVTLQPPAPLIGTTGFFRSIASAFGDGIDIAASITLFLIRALLALIPVILLLGVPAYFLLRFLARRLRVSRPAPPAPQTQPFPPQPPPQDYHPRPSE